MAPKEIKPKSGEEHVVTTLTICHEGEDKEKCRAMTAHNEVFEITKDTFDQVKELTWPLFYNTIHMTDHNTSILLLRKDVKLIFD